MAQRWPGVATVAAVATLMLPVACETPPPRGLATNAAEAAQMRADVDSGLSLYRSRDFVLAAQRFREAANGARRCGVLPMERKATTAECTAWLQARKLGELASCTERLE
ncbi:MAG: hypothetical protein JRG84_17030 [Deltaproteobacteria bacterium]|nr:hypothetical protein [Deltaproteobacteria bacterium]